MSAAEERLANDPSSELWGEHRSRYRFAAQVAAGAVEGTLARACPPGDAASTSCAAARLRTKQSSVIRRGREREPRHGRPRQGLVVLDVACGAGFGLELLGQAGASAIGVDYAVGALWDIRRRQPHARLVRGDAMRLPLTDATVDLVVSFETIEHVPDAEALLCEIRRVLKPGGRLVLSTPNRAFGPPERHTGNPFHVREFTADELGGLLRAAFDQVQLFGQRPSAAYRYVPFLMVEPHDEPSALVWKALLRLPVGLRNSLALAHGGRPFYPGEDDYRFEADACDGAHALVAVAC